MRYATSIDGTGRTSSETTLYESCKQLVDTVGGNVVGTDEAGGKFVRLVAFWCGYEHRVKPGFQATEAEQQAVKDYRL